jgi:cytochrome c553
LKSGHLPVRARLLATLVALGLAVWSAAAWAQAPAATALPPAALLQACAACHGAGGQSREPTMPSLAAQPRLFTETQLVLIREGLREVPTMTGVMQGMSDETIRALAAYFEAQPLRSPSSATPSAGRPDAVQRGAALSRQGLCGSCHLSDYRGQQQVPRLAGQQEAYLLASMQHLRDRPGPGRDTLMTATLQGLSDSDLGALAHYLAHQVPQPMTPPVPPRP